MREIKFRAYDKEKKMYAYNIENEYDTLNDVEYEDGEEPPMDCFANYLEDENWVVEQFTGLKDKNGKEIYEGDIVEYIIADYFPPETTCAPNIIDGGQGEVYYNKLGFEIRDAEYPMDCYELEIIGHIYEENNNA